MTKFIKHRVNQITDLKNFNVEWGAEIDLRSDVTMPNSLFLQHDPWKKGDSFREWLKVFAEKKIHGTLILNTKEDSLEEQCLSLLKEFSISNFFFLDTTVPTTVKWIKKGLGENLSIRLSSYEPVELAKKFSGKVKWAWVDCFDGIPVSIDELKAIKKLGFKTCLVSPELQGFGKEKFSEFEPIADLCDAICTKMPETW